MHTPSSYKMLSVAYFLHIFCIDFGWREPGEVSAPRLQCVAAAPQYSSVASEIQRI